MVGFGIFYYAQNKKQTHEVEAIRAAFIKENPHWDEPDYFSISVEEMTSAHAIGTITWNNPETRTATWFAAKDGNAWSITNYGPGYFGTCQQFQKYSFPQEMTPDCWDADKEVIVNTSNPERFYNGLSIEDKEEIKTSFLQFMGPDTRFQDQELYVKYNNIIDGYVRGMILIGGSENISAPQFFAAKRDSEWHVLYYGQENPNCSDIEGYDFPTRMISGCWDGNDWIER